MSNALEPNAILDAAELATHQGVARANLYVVLYRVHGHPTPRLTQIGDRMHVDVFDEYEATRALQPGLYQVRLYDVSKPKSGSLASVSLNIDHPAQAGASPPSPATPDPSTMGALASRLDALESMVRGIGERVARSVEQRDELAAVERALSLVKRLRELDPAPPEPPPPVIAPPDAPWWMPVVGRLADPLSRLVDRIAPPPQVQPLAHTTPPTPPPPPPPTTTPTPQPQPQPDPVSASEPVPKTVAEKAFVVVLQGLRFHLCGGVWSPTIHEVADVCRDDPYVQAWLADTGVGPDSQLFRHNLDAVFDTVHKSIPQGSRELVFNRLGDLLTLLGVKDLPYRSPPTMAGDPPPTVEGQ